MAWLRSEGHDATHLWEEGLQRLPDRAIWRKAASERRAILTFDLDFGEVSGFAKNARAGVVLFRLRNTRTSHVIERLMAALGECSNALAAGALVIVEETRLRVRHFPI
ncbi:MAG: DUF5615 family PIN-like protein [Candidatus Sumerlaeota bacterium]|nr:DUF5615 family PIN-like protein [Candidatus Sumerlaeota bacterium]